MKINERYVSTGKKGYIILPRELITEVIKQHSGIMSEDQAYITMLTFANYKQVKTSQKTYERGEMEFSQREWGKRLGWNMIRLRIFIKKLEDNNIISINRDKKPYILTMLKYEQLCANRKEEPQESKPVNRNDKAFETFWELYHEVTRLPPHDIELARKTWSSLTPGERQMATDHIEEYYMGLESVKHVRKAVNYLKNKTFVL